MTKVLAGPNMDVHSGTIFTHISGLAMPLQPNHKKTKATPNLKTSGE